MKAKVVKKQLAAKKLSLKKTQSMMVADNLESPLLNDLAMPM
jgi:hypothetical protein